ncbi:nucleotidyltransferase family protein [Fredinandcohnia humi]
MHRRFQLDLTRLPRETKLLLEIIKLENITVLSASQKEMFKHIDWELFLELVFHHRIFPYIYSKITKLDEELIPSYIVQTISQYYRNNTFKMLQLCGEMEQISKLFIENEINPLFLKGPVLATDLYGDISLRTSGDLDVLIPIENLEIAEELLQVAGYTKDDYIQTVLNDWKWRHHHFTYFHPKKGIKLELHWRLNPAPSKEPTFKDLWDRKRTYSKTCFPVYFLGIEDLFLFLVTHGARHGWSRLRWLVDIQQLVKKGLDWGKLVHHLKKYRCDHIGGQALILASQLLSTPVVIEMWPICKGKRPLKLAQQAIFYIENIVHLHKNPLPPNVSKYHAHHLVSLMTIQQKLFNVISMFHPYHTDVQTLPLPKKWHFLYFLLRPFLLLKRRKKKYSLHS